MNGDELSMILFLGLVFFGTLSIYPIWYLLDIIAKRRKRDRTYKQYQDYQQKMKKEAED